MSDTINLHIEAVAALKLTQQLYKDLINKIARSCHEESIRIVSCLRAEMLRR